MTTNNNLSTYDILKWDVIIDGYNVRRHILYIKPDTSLYEFIETMDDGFLTITLHETDSPYSGQNLSTTVEVSNIPEKDNTDDDSCEIYKPYIFILDSVPYLGAPIVKGKISITGKHKEFDLDSDYSNVTKREDIPVPKHTQVNNDDTESNYSVKKDNMMFMLIVGIVLIILSMIILTKSI